MFDDKKRQEGENIPEKTEVNWSKLMNTKTLKFYSWQLLLALETKQGF